MLPNFSVLGISSNQFPDPYKKPQKSGTLAIIGGGRCVWDDVEKLGGNFDVMCVNDIIMHYPGEIQYAYSNDARWLPKWLSARRPRYVMEQGKPQLHSCNQGNGITSWPFPGHGTSGLNAVYVGIAMGYDEIVLCGVPMDGSGHYFDPESLKTNYTGGMRFWKNVKSLHPRVYSMSGNTKELLGEPPQMRLHAV